MSGETEPAAVAVIAVVVLIALSTGTLNLP
jgi:hypothetical protein